MTLKPIRSGTPAFRRALRSLFARRLDDLGALDDSVRRILNDVRGRGDQALIDFTAKFDRVKLSARSIRVSKSEIESARDRLSASDRKSLELAARRIRDYHKHTLERGFSYRDRLGVMLGQLVRPIARVGIYVPGGQGAYPSSVLMNAIPAKVAGVGEIVMVTPPSAAGVHHGVLAAAAIAGVTEVYRVGGAHSIAALAYGTRSIRPVDKIVGPGNAWVQAAKRLVYGVVDVDKMAGPSEILVIADENARPDWIAADLIAQAEHGSGDESAVLLTDSAPLAQRVIEILETALADLPRAASVRQVLAKRSAFVVVRSLDEAFDLANRIGPEHLELEIEQPRKWLSKVRCAGAVFIGAISPAPFGDYIAGPNHVLPTGGSARFASPLGAYDFIKRSSIVEASARAIAYLGPDVIRLARMEGFEGHARSIELRLKAESTARTTERRRNGHRTPA
jgi:histidinol dehydrogenase